MSTFISGELKDTDAYYDFEPVSRQSLSTLNDFEDEAWSFMRHVVLYKNSWSLSVKDKKLFSVLIDRAELFYKQYKNLGNDPAAGLMAYYFALNLAKACICVQLPDKVRGKVLHGLGFDPAKVTKVSLKNKPDDVFPMLLKSMTGSSLVKTVNFDVKELATVVREMTSQVILNGMVPKAVYFTNILSISRQDGKAWIVGRTSPSEARAILNSPARYLNKFNAHFERVEIEADQRSQWFGESARASRDYIYFQSRKSFELEDNLVDGLVIEQYIKDSFSGFCEPNILDIQYKYVASTPFKGRSRIFLDEGVAAYLLIFWCSSVVRYDPTVSVIGTRYSRQKSLFDESIRVCPYIFLRYALNILAGHRMLFIARN